MTGDDLIYQRLLTDVVGDAPRYFIDRPFTHYQISQCWHDDFECPKTSPCGDWSGRDGRDG
jgi:hypothetical protein